MSASLVGSEMCIRDRCAEIFASAASPSPGRPVGRDPSPSVMNTVKPVSYTHLTLPTICSV
eukprot:15256881-Alexandrium_andersonii.AAC.1